MERKTNAIIELLDSDEDDDNVVVISSSSSSSSSGGEGGALKLAIMSLVSMGYSDDISKTALTSANGNLDLALDFLLDSDRFATNNKKSVFVSAVSSFSSNSFSEEEKVGSKRSGGGHENKAKSVDNAIYVFNGDNSMDAAQQLEVGEMVRLVPGVMRGGQIGLIVDVDENPKSMEQLCIRVGSSEYWYNRADAIKISSSVKKQRIPMDSSEFKHKALEDDGDGSEYYNSDYVTYGIVHLLRKQLLQIDPLSTNFKLCSNFTPHICQISDQNAESDIISRGVSDSSSKEMDESSNKREGWSCGYRNIQMLCVGLMSQGIYRGVLFNGSANLPDVPVLQQWIERAWRQGFDKIGARLTFGFPEKRLVDSKEWIGPHECASLLLQFGIRAVVVNFDIRDRSSPLSIPQRLESWLRRYFIAYENYNRSRNNSSSKSNSSSSSCQTENNFIPSIYFQQKGHSRSIIGFECTTSKNQNNSSKRGKDNKSALTASAPALEKYGFVSSNSVSSDGLSAPGVSSNSLNMTSAQNYFPRLHMHPLSEATALRKQKSECDYCSRGCPFDVKFCCTECDFDLCTECVTQESKDINSSTTTSNNTSSDSNRIRISNSSSNKMGDILQDDKSFNLLVFDPAHNGRIIKESLASCIRGDSPVNSKWKSSLKRGMHTFNRMEYQLVYIRPGLIVNPVEMEACKTIYPAKDSDEIHF